MPLLEKKRGMMKIEDSIKIPRNAICKKRNYFYSIHINPKNGNEIRSWFDNKGNLIKRFIFDESESGFGIYYNSYDGFLWLYPFKGGFVIFENKIAIGRFGSGK